MARVNINILGISELKWTRIDKFNSGGQYIYYCGQESLRRNGVALIVNRRVQNAVVRCNLKNSKIISVCKANHSTSQLSMPQLLMLKKLKLKGFCEDL